MAISNKPKTPINTDAVKEDARRYAKAEGAILESYALALEKELKRKKVGGRVIKWTSG